MTTHHSATMPPTRDRLAVVRRLYFYIVALVSLIFVVVSIDGLIAALADAWLGETAQYQVDAYGYLRDVIARNGGLLLVAAPVFLIHWRAIQRRQDEPAERGSGLRSFFLHAALLVTGGYAVLSSYNLLWGIAFIAYGGAPEASGIWPADWLHLLLTAAFAGGLFAYFDRIARASEGYGAEEGIAGTWRRVYLAVVGLIGLSLLIFGGARLLGTALEVALTALVGRPEASVSADGWWTSSQLANGTITALLGAVLARFNWRRWSAITRQHPDEARAALRRFYLYAGVVVSALATLVPSTLVLRELLLTLFGGQGGTVQELLFSLVAPLAFVPMGVLAWRWHWRYLSQEAASYGESAQGATVRRLYYYAVAATGLVLLWLGAINLLQVALDWLLVAKQVDKPAFWMVPLATGLSLLAVGLPVWAAHWRVVQSVARSEGDEGRRERASLPRRAYLYGVALVGALLILFYLAQVLYRLLLLLLGDPNAQIMSGETVDEIARGAIAAALWAIHVLAIRTDLRLGAEEPEEEAVADEAARRTALEERIARLEAELAAARAELSNLPPTESAPP